MSATKPFSPLLIEWSPTLVRVYDGVTGQWSTGATIGECGVAGQTGREAVVAVVQRSAFIRAVPMPNVPRDEIAKLLPAKLAPLIPLPAGEYVYGFRVGVDHGQRAAIVGAVKTSSLRRIFQEGEASGLKIRTVLPLSFGSWLLAHEKAIKDCAVLDLHESAVSIDIVSGGELRYSRSIPLPESRQELDEEVERSFSLAGVAPSTTISAGSPELSGNLSEPRKPIQFLADSHLIGRLLFSLELPETVLARRERSQKWAAQRALTAAIAATILAFFVVRGKNISDQQMREDKRLNAGHLEHEEAERKEADARAKRAEAAQNVLNAAFHPAQSFTDMVAVLGERASPKSWLTGLTIERGKPLYVRGSALTGHVVATYEKDLSKERRFRDMKLVFSSKVLIGGKEVEQFAISGHAVGNLPIDMPLDTEVRN